MANLPFLIAGGGIAGLSTALGLAKAGRDVRLFEQADAFEEVGAGLQMSPNAVRGLQALGAWEAVEPHCVIPSVIHVRDGLAGKLLQRIRLGKPFEEKFGAPYRVAHRADLLAGLVAAARAHGNVALQTSSPASAARSTEDGAILRLTSGAEISGAGVIGADGIRSIIRTAVLGGGEPRLHGHTLYRALLPLTDVPPSIAADAVTLWFLPGAHVVHYPVSAWRQFNIVTAVEQDWPGESWSSQASRSDFESHFDDLCPALADLIARPSSWLKWRGASLDPQPRWQNGNIVIVGDAAHATLPYLAQGAAMAIEDAAVLSASITRSNVLPESLADFASRRQPRTSRVQKQSLAQGDIYHARGARRLARNLALRFMPEANFLERLRWIYSWRP